MSGCSFSKSIKELPYEYFPGKVFRCSMPGFQCKHEGIDQDITLLKTKNVSQVVLLTSDEEAFFQTTTKLRDEYRKAGIEVIHFPIGDGEAPDNRDVSVLLSKIKEQAEQGKNVAIHCMGGNGRTGVITACLARKLFNISGEDAIKWVRTFVPKAVESRIQNECVMKFLEEESVSNFQKSLTPMPYDFEKGSITRCTMPGYKRVTPEIQKDIEALKSRGITHVVLLTQEEEYKHVTGLDLKKEYENAGLVVWHLPIKDFGVPDPNDFAALMEQIRCDVSLGANIAVHCLGGRGRTGLVLACLARKVFQLPALEAIEWVRQTIPGAVESKEQKEFLADFIKQPETIFSQSLILLPFSLKKGEIYRSIMPCSFEKPQDAKRCLMRDILTLKARGISHVALLATDEECFKMVGVDLKKEYEKYGISVIHLPIPDGGLPEGPALIPFLEKIHAEVSSGAKVAVHCRGGTGRTGIVVALLARMMLGLTAKQAIVFTRKFIPGGLQESSQAEYVTKFGAPKSGDDSCNVM